MSDCVFCRVLAGTAPGTFVHRDDVCAAFMDIRPVNPGHVLVVPLEHVPSLAALKPATAGHLMEVSLRMASAIRASGVRCEGINLYVADGAAAGQEVYHTHVHVLPRYRGDGVSLRAGPHDPQSPPRAELEKIASLIRSADPPPPTRPPAARGDTDRHGP